MRSVPLARIRLACGLALSLLISSASSLSAQEEAKQQLELMRAALGSLEPESSELKTKDALAAASKPLLRYSDPTRGGINAAAANVLLDGGVWRLGSAGRPTALVTVELYQAPDKSRILAFEFLSFSEAKFSLKHRTQRVRWDATGSALEMKTMPDAPRPAASAAARLAQMRQMARRFVVKERIANDSIECRLLAQPIDRYQSAAEKISDGALFAYANGTNPEVGVLFESDGEHWRYSIVRFTSAEATVTLDGRQAASFASYNPRGRTDGPYHNASYRLPRGK